MEENIQPKPAFQIKIWHIILGLFLILMGSYLLFLFTSKSKLQEEIDKMQAEGLPTSYMELVDYIKLPKGTVNGADTYYHAFYLARKVTEEQRNLIPGQGEVELYEAIFPLSEQVKQALSEYLLQNQKCLEALYQAGAIENCRFSPTFTPNGGLLIPHLTEIREMQRILCIEAVQFIHDNNVEKLVENFKTQSKLADSLKGEPFLIPYLVRIACWKMAIQSLELSLSHIYFDAGQIKQIESFLSDTKNDTSLKDAFQGEKCFILEIVQNPDLFKSTFPGGARIPLKGLGIMELNAAKYLELMNQYTEITMLSYSDKIQSLSKIEQETSNLSFFYSLTKMAFPSLNRIFYLDLSWQITISNAETALAVERYRLDQQNLPRSLDQLVPDYLEQVPLDPFDGKPLRYVLLEPGYIVYSVGEDMQDQTGKRKEKEQSDKEYDIPFIVTR